MPTTAAPASTRFSSLSLSKSTRNDDDDDDKARPTSSRTSTTTTLLSRISIQPDEDPFAPPHSAAAAASQWHLGPPPPPVVQEQEQARSGSGLGGRQRVKEGEGEGELGGERWSEDSVSAAVAAAAAAPTTNLKGEGGVKRRPSSLLRRSLSLLRIPHSPRPSSPSIKTSDISAPLLASSAEEPRLAPLRRRASLISLDTARERRRSWLLCESQQQQQRELELEGAPGRTSRSLGPVGGRRRLVVGGEGEMFSFRGREGRSSLAESPEIFDVTINTSVKELETTPPRGAAPSSSFPSRSGIDHRFALLSLSLRNRDGRSSIRSLLPDSRSYAPPEAR